MSNIRPVTAGCRKEPRQPFAMKASPLQDLHERNGAVFLQREGWRLPAHFRDPAAEYDAVRSGAGWFDLADRAMVSVTGPDSAEWLQGMLSNDVQVLGTGEGTPAAVLNIQGKILADVRVFRTGDAFLLDLDEPLLPGVLAHLHRYLIADEVELGDLSPRFSLVSVQGPAAEAALARLLGTDPLPATDLSHREFEWAGGGVRVIRATHTGEPGFDLAAPAGALPGLAALPAVRDLPWIGVHAQEVLRIEAGIPRYGVDMDAETLLLETCLDNAVSFAKGCYLGQETVERIHSRGHVNRKLVGLRVEGHLVPGRDDPVLHDGRPVGRVTSATASPRLQCPIALGYVHRDCTEPGSAVTIAHGAREVAAAVHALPF